MAARCQLCKSLNPRVPSARLGRSMLLPRVSAMAHLLFSSSVSNPGLHSHIIFVIFFCLACI